MRAERVQPLGYWTISGEDLLVLLYRVAKGEKPDMIYAELYANSLHEWPEGNDEHPASA